MSQNFCRSFVGIAAGASLCACVAAPVRSAPQSCEVDVNAPATAPTISRDVPVATAGGVTDTETMLHPDPAVRTWEHLYALRSMLGRYATSRRHLPASMNDFAPPDPSGLQVEIDGWGNPILYTRVDAGYVLRSRGPDNRFCTLDDVLVVDGRLPPRPPENGGG